jgi:hypothetical protein
MGSTPHFVRRIPLKFHFAGLATQNVASFERRANCVRNLNRCYLYVHPQIPLNLPAFLVVASDDCGSSDLSFIVRIQRAIVRRLRSPHPQQGLFIRNKDELGILYIYSTALSPLITTLLGNHTWLVVSIHALPTTRPTPAKASCFTTVLSSASHSSPQ